MKLFAEAFGDPPANPDRG